nr:venom serine carboxypeptidase-like [Halyomorpha halys]
MNRLVLLLFLCSINSYVSSIRLNPYPKIQSIPTNGDAGDPLFLTPYIEGGKIQEGQAAAEVRLSGSNITSYSGYLTVNKTFNSNLFFWFFPSETNPKNAPVVLWLQGGPGGSSLFGLFCENGAFSVDQNYILKERQYYWSKLFNVIYIDNPVGTGFSFTESDSEYATDEVKVGKDLYSALIQFFQLFPYLQKNEFFVTGESYAGKYIPAIGYTIHKNNKINKQKINLKGLAIGDGWTDPENMMVYADYVYQLGLVDSNTRDVLRNLQDEAVKSIKEHKYSEASAISDKILGRLSPQINVYNYLQTSSFNPDGYYSAYLQSTGVRKSIHVGNRVYNDGSIVARYLQNDEMQSVKPWVEVLLDNYRVMFYSGQLDIIVAYPLTMNFLPKLNWTGAEDYRTAPRQEWKVGRQLAGFYKKAKGLTEVLVRDSGHMVPQDQPKWAFDLISRFIYNKFK